MSSKLSSPKTATLAKTAVDQAAEDYWKSYFEDTGYGADWVKSIPRRVAAELKRAQAGSKTASKLPAGTPELKHLASSVTDAGVSLEGLAAFGEGVERQVQAFSVDFDHEGEVLSFDTLSLK